MPNKKALIFGVTGQDGSYLAELLLDKGYEVYGVRRRSSSFNTSRIDHLIRDRNKWNKTFFLEYGDLSDQNSIDRILSNHKFQEIYNLAAQSHVGLSFEQPLYTTDVNGTGTLRILDSIVRHQNLNEIKFYQASTSELFGLRKTLNSGKLNEESKFEPQSPYATSKLFAFESVRLYRESLGLHASNGILFNHESARRGETFVTRKITRGLSRIKTGLQEDLILGNLNAIRDWGHARDYVSAMHLILQNSRPIDVVIATGVAVSVREFANLAGVRLGFNLIWQGEGINEIGIDQNSGKTVIRVAAEYFRPLEVDYLLGDASKAREVLDWEPKVTLQELVNEMTMSDLKRAEIEAMNPGIFRT